MRYRSFGDRRVSVYGAILIITIIGSVATLYIVREISTINFALAANIPVDGGRP